MPTKSRFKAHYFNHGRNVMGARKYTRKIVKARMEESGCTQINKTRYKSVDHKGNATTVVRPSFFSMMWNRDRANKKKGE